MIPWLLVAELLSKSGRPLSQWIRSRLKSFPSSGESNFRVEDTDAAIERVLSNYIETAISVDYTDGVSMTFPSWRFNLRRSNTEPLVRLNIEAKGTSVKLMNQTKVIAQLLGGESA